ncbi:MAG TPA: M23 family metallopeptidase [Vicinamibacterales bacterium]|nr:M23 family metallopeptidase [Vicinamibacterales bacterium]
MVDFRVHAMGQWVDVRAVVCAAAILAAACQPSGRPAPGSARPGDDVVLARDTDVVEALVPRNATLEMILRQHNLPPDVAAPLVGAVREVFNPRHIRANQPYRVTRTLDGLFREFRYQIDSDRFLRVLARDVGRPEFDVDVVPYPKDIVPDAAFATVSSERPSLIAALNAEGETQLLALDVANVFGGLVDFNSDLQQGDRVDVLFDRVLRSGRFTGYERVRAAVLQNDGRTFMAFPFAQADGTTGWYDEEGRSLKRRFLKSPLLFQTSISSGFSYRRLHPISRQFRAHPAIDYRAPRGAPVVAVADGVVVFAAMSGASGRLVRIRHAGGYETMYLHLSAFGPGIRAGARVSQADVIGRVGDSGAATGVHLDYRMRKNGAYVNPLLEHRRMPPGDPIADAELEAFKAERDRLLTELATRRDDTTGRRALN